MQAVKSSSKRSVAILVVGGEPSNSVTLSMPQAIIASWMVKKIAAEGTAIVLSVVHYECACVSVRCCGSFTWHDAGVAAPIS